MKMQLIIAKVHEEVFEGEVDSITLPGASGEFTVLAGHEPFITPLKKGLVTIRTGENEEMIEVQNGLVEVHSKRTTVLL